AFITDPAGDADMQIQIEVAVQGVPIGGEAMHYRSGQTVAEIPQDGAERVDGLAFMYEERIAQLRRQFQLTLEGAELHWPRGEDAIEVQAAFTDGPHRVGLGQQAQIGFGIGTPVTGVMGMDTRRAE